MSTHPNAMLICRLTPDGTSRKTMRAIKEAAGPPDSDEDYITIGGKGYHALVLEEDYYEGYQISGREGDLVFFDFLTYGYGEAKAWSDVVKQQSDLEAWAQEQCATHGGTYVIEIGANYW